MTNKTLIRKLIDDVAIYLPGKILPAMAGLISIPFYARAFSTDQYGVLSLLLAIVGLGQIIVCNWLTSSMVRFQPYYQKHDQLLRYNTTMFVAFSLATVLFLFFWFFATAYLGSTSLDKEILSKLPLVAGIILVIALFRVFLTIFRINRQPKHYVSFDLLQVYGALSLWLLLVSVLGFGVEGVLWGTIIATTLVTVIMLLITVKQGLRIQLNKFSKNTLKEFIKYGVPGSFATIGTWILSLSDRYIVEIYKGSTEVGYYSMGYTISNQSIGVVVSSIIMAVSPILVTTWETKGKEATEKFLSQVTKVMVLLVVPMVFGLYSLVEPMFIILATEKYLPSTQVAVWVASGVFLYGLSLLSYSGLIVAKKMGVMARNALIAGVINIVLNIIFVPKFGFNAAAVTTLVSFAILLVLNTLSANQYLAWKFPWRSFANALFASTIMAGFLIFLNGYLPLGIPSLILLIVMGILIYAIVLLLLGEPDKQVRQKILKRLIAR